MSLMEIYRQLQRGGPTRTFAAKPTVNKEALLQTAKIASSTNGCFGASSWRKSGFLTQNLVTGFMSKDTVAMTCAGHFHRHSLAGTMGHCGYEKPELTNIAWLGPKEEMDRASHRVGK